jgi:hypothetical protein
MSAERNLDRNKDLKRVSEIQRHELQETIAELRESLTAVRTMLENIKATTVNFCTRDGEIACTFVPPLTPGQYEQVYDLAQSEITSQEEIHEALGEVARVWGVEYTLATAS